MRTSCRTIEHVGEWRIHMASDSLPGLFGCAARAIARECGAPVGQPLLEMDVSIQAPDAVGLMVAWMNELLGLSEMHGLALEVREVTDASERHLEARISGRRVCEWRSSVKAATYHDARVERIGERWHAVILLDV